MYLYKSEYTEELVAQMDECTHASRDVSLESLANTPTWGSRLMALLVSMSNIVLDAQRRAAERHYLASMDEHMLRDVGLGRADLERELNKRFWEK